MPLTHRHIEVFRALMTTGSVTAAAQLLFTSQPTVSRELARMEQLTGLPLFDRVRGRLRATTQALALFDEVQRSHIGLERIRQTAAQLKQHGQGLVSVLSLPFFSQTLLPGACARLIEQHPGVSLHITLQESPFLEQLLSSQTHDVGLTEHDRAPPGTRQTALLQADEVAVLPEGHALTRKRQLKLKDFAGQPFVSLAASDPYRQQLDALFAQQGVVPVRQIETPSAASVCAMVAQGLGLSIVNPLTAMDHVGRGLVVRRLSPSIPFRASLVRPLQRPGNWVVDALEAALQAQAKERLHLLAQSLR
jgi:DNA-binding transcriptional LysR family regulator